MDYKKFLASKSFRSALIGIGIFFIALAIFEAGMMVGFHKAGFSYGLGNNYYKNFGRAAHGPMGEIFPERDFANSHGTVGTIIKLDLPTIVIEGKDGIEKAVLIKDTTEIRRFRDVVAQTDLHINDSVVILGNPDDTSQIVATLIRVLPSLATSTQNVAR